jgi:hypothetical protein
VPRPWTHRYLCFSGLNWRLLFLPADHAKEYELLRTNGNCPPRYGPHRQPPGDTLIINADDDSVVRQALASAAKYNQLPFYAFVPKLTTFSGSLQELLQEAIGGSHATPAESKGLQQSLEKKSECEPCLDVCASCCHAVL